MENYILNPKSTVYSNNLQSRRKCDDCIYIFTKNAAEIYGKDNLTVFCSLPLFVVHSQLWTRTSLLDICLVIVWLFRLAMSSTVLPLLRTPRKTLANSRTGKNDSVHRAQTGSSASSSHSFASLFLEVTTFLFQD